MYIIPLNNNPYFKVNFVIHILIKKEYSFWGWGEYVKP